MNVFEKRNKNDLLYSELNEQHNYVRNTSASFTQWFGVFGTLQFVAIGWIMTSTAPFLTLEIKGVVCIFMMAQCCLGYRAIQDTNNYYRDIAKRSETLINLITQENKEFLKNKTMCPLPINFYEKIMSSMKGAMILDLLLWPLILIYNINNEYPILNFIN